MGEGRAELAGSRNTVRTMATRDSYETGFDEDVRQYRVRTNVPSATAESPRTRSKTVCKDCGLVIDEQRIDHGPEWRAYVDKDYRFGIWLMTVLRHFSAYQRRILFSPRSPPRFQARNELSFRRVGSRRRTQFTNIVNHAFGGIHTVKDGETGDFRAHLDIFCNASKTATIQSELSSVWA